MLRCCVGFTYSHTRSDLDSDDHEMHSVLYYNHLYILESQHIIYIYEGVWGNGEFYHICVWMFGLLYCNIMMNDTNSTIM